MVCGVGSGGVVGIVVVVGGVSGGVGGVSGGGCACVGGGEGATSSSGGVDVSAGHFLVESSTKTNRACGGLGRDEESVIPMCDAHCLSLTELLHRQTE